jgi:hypothetical protein
MQEQDTGIFPRHVGVNGNDLDARRAQGFEERFIMHPSGFQPKK